MEQIKTKTRSPSSVFPSSVLKASYSDGDALLWRVDLLRTTCSGLDGVDEGALANDKSIAYVWYHTFHARMLPCPTRVHACHLSASCDVFLFSDAAMVGGLRVVCLGIVLAQNG